MRLPESFRSLRSREFRAFFGAQTISQIATWMLSLAQVWLILSLTNSPLLGSFPIAAPLIGAVSERSSVGIAFFVWGAGGLATLAMLMGARHCLERRRSALASVP